MEPAVLLSYSKRLEKLQKLGIIRLEKLKKMFLDQMKLERTIYKLDLIGLQG